jgi:hypothetical protein
MFGEAGELRASMSSYGADFVQEADAGVPILDAKWSKVASRYDVFLSHGQFQSEVMIWASKYHGMKIISTHMSIGQL